MFGNYRVFKLKNGLKFSYDGDSEIIHQFINWCYDNELIDRNFYVCFNENEMESRGVVFIKGA